MIETINQTSYGCVHYAIGNISEKDQLPKKGIKSGSTARLIEASGLRIFIFKRPSREVDGEWVEI